MRQFFSRLAVAALLLTTVSCVDDGPDFIWLRVVHSIPDAPAVRATFDDFVFRRDTFFGLATPESGESLLGSAGSSTEITVRYFEPAGLSAEVLLTAEVPVERDSTSTVVLAGTFDAPEAIVVVAPRLKRPLAELTFQFVNAALDEGPLDVYVTAPDTPLTSAAPLATLAPRAASAITTIPFGALRIRLTPAGSLDLVYDSGELAFPQSTAATGPGTQWLFTVTPDRTPGVAPIFLIGSAGQVALRYFDVRTEAVLRAYHGGPSLPVADLVAATEPPRLLYEGLEYRGRTPVLSTPTGAYQLQFRAPGSEEPASGSLARQFLRGQEYSAFLYATAEGLAILYNDSSSRSIGTEARIRLGNLSRTSKYFSFYFSASDTDPVNPENLFYRDLFPAVISPHLPRLPGNVYLTVTERIYNTAAEAANAEETIVYGPMPLELAGGDVLTWLFFPPEGEDQPEVFVMFDDLVP
jgi:trimeric autotransporter adhesin